MANSIHIMKNLYDYIGQIGVAFDQLINALWPSVFWGHLSYADETLSARCWRSRDKRMPRIMRPIIDWMFAWQTPDVMDDAGEPIVSHCHRAFQKEIERRGLPPEYRWIHQVTTGPTHGE